jgi:hypothetical protein
MRQDNAIPIDVAALRAKDYSSDSKNIIISLTTRFSTEHTFSVPVECVYELIADLQKLNSAKGPTPVKTAEQSVTRPPATDLNRINVTVPKKWMLKSALPNHPLVIMIMDPQTETQAGYALTASAAQEMAIGLIKYADTVTKHEAKKRNLS